MEAIYENFYELHAYALTFGLFYYLGQPFLSYLYNNSKLKIIFHPRKNYYKKL